jgi:hypothetical protein
LRFEGARTMLRGMKPFGKLLCLLVIASGVPFASLLACGGGESNLPPPPPSATGVVSTASTSTASATPTVTTPPQPPAPPPALVLGPASDDPKPPLPTVKITAPTSGQVIAADKAGDFVVKLDVKNWQTAMGSQHVHLILDNHPYKPIYDPKLPVKLSELMGGDPLNEGEHIIVAFPSRANHESVKTAGAISMLSFWVGKKAGTPTDLKKQPMLVYSRPKGDYKGLQASHVIVDWQLANVTLAEGKTHVHITVTGPGIDDKLEAKAEKFGPPYFLDNLQNGIYTVKLELMSGTGADMKLIPGAWNSTVRSIRIDHDAQPDAMPAASGSASAAPPAMGH